MDESSSSSTTDSDHDGAILVVDMVVQIAPCRCLIQDLLSAIWVSGERSGARCGRCLRRVDSRRLSPHQRLLYLVLRSLWSERGCRQGP